MDDERPDYPDAPPSRRQRNLARHKDCLLCEWCRRWTECDHDLWYRAYKSDKEYVWYCKRPRCVSERREVMEVPKA